MTCYGHVLRGFEYPMLKYVILSESDIFGTQNIRGSVMGVLIVAEGAGNATVDARISAAVKALFSVDAHKISIVKMRSQEGD